MFNRNMIPGILGMLLTIAALVLAEAEFQRTFFAVGALGMTLTALLEGHRLFIGLQLIVLSGTVAAFLPLSVMAKGFVPLAASIPTLGFLAMHKSLNTRNDWFGSLALATLGVGYAVQHPLGFFVGGALISIFSAIELRRGFKPAVIWLVLNLVFTGLSGAKVAAEWL
jgi:hypothetical protein